VSDSDFKHRRISRDLLSAIAAGRYAVGARLPSEAQLVARHGVSRPTVIRALKEMEAQGVIERRMGSGSFVRRPATNATSTRQLGLLIPGLGRTEIFELICGELAAVARAHDFSLLWGGSEHPRTAADLGFGQARECCEQFIRLRVGGVFFAPFELIPGREDTNREIAERLRMAGIPVVLIDRDLGPFPKRSDFDLVGLDNMAAGHLLAEHFLKLGCERIAFVARPHSASTVDARIAGVREALARRGMELARDWVRFGEPTEARFVRGLVAGRRWDALLCANDRTAAELLQELQKQGHRVPEDIRIAGFDDVRYATLLSRPLTTVHQPCREIAVAALRAMLDRIAEPTLPARSQLLTPTLVVRESCGTYLGSAGRAKTKGPSPDLKARG
jgi:DNA-binding LacI/PurR family transcriptional regulator